MKFFMITAALAAFACQAAFATGGPWHVNFQNQKNPTQRYIEFYSWANPALGSSISVLAAGAASSAAPTTFSAFAAQPDYPRNLVITPTGTTANVGAGTAVVTGTNIFGKVISENFAIGAAQSSATTGSKAFKSVTSVVFPQATGAGVTVNIVAGAKLGTNQCSSFAQDYAWSGFGGVYDTTRGVYAPGTAAVESNTFTPNSAMDGAHNVALFYTQNYQCYGN